ncbi:MAG: hypothetical protein ACLUOI_16865 [Eisenbergiella sp.]
MFDVVALGELIDFTPYGAAKGKSFLEQNPGGAPANVPAALAKLNEDSLIGKWEHITAGF